MSSESCEGPGSDSRPAMPPPPATCPNQTNSDGSQRESCPLQSKYNYFESDDLTIDTYELKCLDCGWRDTVGYRSEDEDQPENPKQCPFCSKCDLEPGRNPCGE